MATAWPANMGQTRCGRPGPLRPTGMQLDLGREPIVYMILPLPRRQRRVDEFRNRACREPTNPRDGHGSGARPRGGEDGRLRLLQQPLDGLAVGLVAELARELGKGRTDRKCCSYYC